jgi:carnitine O-palmitoyltransferase 1
MAEARSAVSLDSLVPRLARPSSERYITITREMIQGSIFPHDEKRSVMTRGARAVVRYVRKRMHQARNSIYDAVFPSTSYSWYVSIASAAGVRKLAPQLGEVVEGYLPFISLVPEGLARHAYVAVVSGSAVWLAGIFASRSALLILMRYKGYMYDAPKRPSTATMVWSSLVKLLFGFGTPRTYSYQNVVPRISVPSLADTCTRYLEAARPLLDDAEFDRMKRLAEDFQDNEGAGLQRLLWLKSWVTPNYISDWWERFVYLRGRDSIMINSNYYMLDSYSWQPTKNPIARAANIIYYILDYKTLLDRDQIEPLLMQGCVPLCMSQYSRTFCTTRVPGLEEDTLQHVNDKHIAVMCGGHFYIFQTTGANGERLNPRDIEKQLQWIVDDSKLDDPNEIERKLPVMTAADRSMWAQFREQYLGEGVSRASLEAIERAAFVLVFDDSSPTHPKDCIKEEDQIAHAAIHGNGFNRWFDKSFNLIVFANGRLALNVEHSWADAPVMAHVWEWALSGEFSGPGYDDVSGMNKALTHTFARQRDPLRLRFNVDPEASTMLDAAALRATHLINDLDLRLLKHDAYSKGLMKRVGLSPDGYIQMALQLAYFRDAGKFAQTYESSMTRLFRNGRTETVRPVSIESVAFVKAMENPELSNKERAALLRKACDRHVERYRSAMCGRGIDRHLFCLYVVSLWRNTPSPFLKEVLSVPWKLSTSQTPVQQTTRWDLSINPNKVCGGGGFGPVNDDGYGVSYIIATDEVVFFHITSKHSSTATSSERFAQNVVKSLQDMRRVVLDK